MKVLLVGNYAPDRQYSMLNFADHLQEQLVALGCDVRLVAAPPVLGEWRRIKGETARKWARYLDKFVFYLPWLIWQMRWADVVHICDQGNAIYAWFAFGKPVVVTCHDLLAARAALGEDTACYPTATGVWLQRLIIATLKRVRHLACISFATAGDARRILEYPNNLQTIHNAPATHFRQLPESDKKNLPPFLQKGKYVLVVGNNEARKNRHGCLLAFAEFARDWDGKLAFVGADLSPMLKQHADDLGIGLDRVVSCPYVDMDQLVRLYNGAYALLFPSYTEGFGYPVVEAQACGCPVVCSNTTSLPEVAGDGALMCAPDDTRTLAANLAKLRDLTLRNEIIERGLHNVSRFTPRKMAESYLRLYKRAAVPDSEPGAIDQLETEPQ